MYTWPKEALRCYFTTISPIQKAAKLLRWRFTFFFLNGIVSCTNPVVFSHRGHIVFAAVTEVGGAHQVQEAAIRGGETGHSLRELRGRLAALGSQLPKQPHRFSVRYTGPAETLWLLKCVVTVCLKMFTLLTLYVLLKNIFFPLIF